MRWPGHEIASPEGRPRDLPKSRAARRDRTRRAVCLQRTASAQLSTGQHTQDVYTLQRLRHKHEQEMTVALFLVRSQSSTRGARGARGVLSLLRCPAPDTNRRRINRRHPAVEAGSARTHACTFWCDERLRSRRELAVGRHTTHATHGSRRKTTNGDKQIRRGRSHAAFGALGQGTRHAPATRR